MERLAWIRTDIPNTKAARKHIAQIAIENGFSDIVVRAEDAQTFEALGRINLIAPLPDGYGVKGASCERVVISDEASERRARAMAGRIDIIVISAVDWKVIPLENLVATCHKTKTRILVEMEDVRNAKLFFGILEKGVDGVVLCSKNYRDVHTLRERLDELARCVLVLEKAVIRSVRPAGLGDRVCVDSCSMLEPGEGMLVGSHSDGLFLMHSETLEAKFVNTRPFRVNAGAVHSYIMTPGDRTLYLSELRAGDEVMAVDQRGRARPVLVGRIKTERRPMVVVEAVCAKRTMNVIVQNAETIRFVRPGGRSVSVVDLREGDAVLVHLGARSRHAGMRSGAKADER